MKEITNKAFRRLMDKAGLSKVLLIKGEGYHYITSEDETTAHRIFTLYDNAIYICSFNQQSPAKWVEDIKLMLNE
jgi:ABC-type uncharacterized transport system ATPase subunit